MGPPKTGRRFWAQRPGFQYCEREGKGICRFTRVPPFSSQVITNVLELWLELSDVSYIFLDNSNLIPVFQLCCCLNQTTENKIFFQLGSNSAAQHFTLTKTSCALSWALFVLSLIRIRVVIEFWDQRMDRACRPLDLDLRLVQLLQKPQRLG